MKLFGENFNFGSTDAIAKRKQQKSGKTLWTQFVGWLNNLFNPEHDWMDYENAPAAGSGHLDNFLKGTTQSGVTAQQEGLNAMQMQNVEDQYQRQVTGMQKAGINPALMYNSGASSAPSAPSGTNMAGLSFSDLVQALTIPAQLKMMKAQTENIYAAAEQKRVQTETEGIRQESLRLANQYYPSMQEATLDKIFSEIGVNDRTMSEKEANTALTWSKQFLQEKENKYADEYLYWRNKLEEAKTNEAIQSAADHMAQAAWTGYQHSYAKNHGVLLSGGPLVGIASMLSDSLSKAFGVRENANDKSKPSVEEVASNALKRLKADDKPSVKPSILRRGLRALKRKAKFDWNLKKYQ